MSYRVCRTFGYRRSCPDSNFTISFRTRTQGPDEELPKTKTKKYIRVGLADKLGFGDDAEDDVAPNKQMKAKIDWGLITGFRFFLACYVML